MDVVDVWQVGVAGVGRGSLYQEKPFIIREKLVATSAAQGPLVSQPEGGNHKKDEQPR